MGVTGQVAVLCPWRAKDGRTGTLLHMWCPACDDAHAVEVASGGWQWDGNIDSPTISPSIKVGGVQWGTEYSFHKPRHHVAPGAQITCHSFVRAGRWEFLGDCTHGMAGRTVAMVPVPDWLASPHAWVDFNNLDGLDLIDIDTEDRR